MSRRKRRTLRIHGIWREHHTIWADENDWSALYDLRLWWETAQHFGAANLDERRGLGSEEHTDRICLGEVLSIDSEHLWRVWIRFGQYCPWWSAIRFRCFGSAIGRKVFHDTREGRYGFRGYRERPCLRRVLVVEQHGRNVEVVADLVCAK